MKINSLTTLRTSRIFEYFSLPLHRNGLALVFSLVTTSSLGIIYWGVAARLYPPEVVGLNSALISAMMFIGNISQFGMVNFLTRFIPKAGRATWRILSYPYLISLVASLIIGIIFVLGVHFWSPNLDTMFEPPILSFWFVGTTMLWCVFALQDGALIGLRKSTWVPVENLLFALVKIGLLFLCVNLLSDYAVFASWSFPLPILVLIVNILIFSRLIPKHANETQTGAEVFSLSQMIKFVAGDYLSIIVWTVTLNLMPVIVLEKVGATANAYFYLPWMITYSLYLVSIYLGMSLTAESAKNPGSLNDYTKHSLTQAGLLLVPAVLIIVFGAQLILQIFGETYATEGVALLRFLALSAIPNIFVSIFISIARVRREVVKIVICLSILCAMAINLTLILLSWYGLPGIGMAWLISQSAMALILVFTEFRSVFFNKAGNTKINRVLSFTHVLSLWNAAWLLPYVKRLLQDINMGMSQMGLGTASDPLQIQGVYRSLSNVTVLSLGSANKNLQAIVQISNSDQATRNFEKRLNVLSFLNNTITLDKWQRCLPSILYEGKINGHPYWVLKRLPGISAMTLISDPEKYALFIDNAIDLITQFHHETSTKTVVGKKELSEWIYTPVNTILQSKLVSYRRNSHKILKDLSLFLADRMAGKKFVVSWVHGDYWPDNILVSPEKMGITGIIDWEHARPGSLPVLDLVNLIVSSRRIIEQREMGDILEELLTEPEQFTFETKILNKIQDLLNGQSPDIKDALLIFWLQHIESLLHKRKLYSYNPVWINKNFIKMINWLDMHAQVLSI